MKKAIPLFVLIISISFNAPAQTKKEIEKLLGHRIMNQDEPAMPTTDVKNHIGEDVYIYDKITGYKVVNDTLKLLYVGKKYPKHLMTILVKGKKLKNEVKFKVGDKWHFSGNAFIYKGKPAITLISSDQLATRIQI